MRHNLIASFFTGILALTAGNAQAVISELFSSDAFDMSRAGYFTEADPEDRFYLPTGDGNVVRLTPVGFQDAVAIDPEQVGVEVADLHYQDGSLYAAGFNTNNVVRVNPNGTIDELINLLSHFDSHGLVFRLGRFVTVAPDGTVYAVSDEDGLFRITPDGELSKITAAIGPIAVNGQGTIHYVGTFSSIETLTSDGVPGRLTDTLPNLGRLEAMKIDLAGNVYALGRDGRAVSKITPSGVATEIFAAGHPDCCLDVPTYRMFEVSPQGTVYIGSAGIACQEVCRISSDGTVTKVLDETADGRPNYVFQPRSLALGPSSGTLFVSGPAVDQTFSGLAVFRVGSPIPPDSDGDGYPNSLDNCPNVSNPDQADSDNDTAYIAVGVGGGPLTQGVLYPKGDACDPCPLVPDQDDCDATKNATAIVDDQAQTVTTPDGSASVDFPSGALASPTSVVVAEDARALPTFIIGTNPPPCPERQSTTCFETPAGRIGNCSPSFSPLLSCPPTIFRTTKATRATMKPAGQTFLQPVTVTLSWDDRDNDGMVDMGHCSSGVDAGLTCDADTDCTDSFCTTDPSRGDVPASVNKDERGLIAIRNSRTFDQTGIGGSGTCEEHAPGGSCETAGADCAASPNSAPFTVAKCCDRDANTWVFETCGFSTFTVGEVADGLIPGGGRVDGARDCSHEWSVQNPFNAASRPFNRKGIVGARQACRDGDLNCDTDGVANGRCVFRVGSCFNVRDRRLSSSSGALRCQPSDVATWELTRPRPTSRRPVEAVNAVSIRDTVAAAGTSSIGGRDAHLVTFDPALTEENQCTSLAEISVPTGRARLRVRTTGATGRSDRDRLVLTCLPGS